MERSHKEHADMTRSQAPDEREAIVRWLRKPMARDWTYKPWSKRIWFAWHLLRGHFGVLDGVRMHAALQIQNGDHLSEQGEGYE
jgi:hypothetical protein